VSVKPLQLIQARRVLADGTDEILAFEPGVNVIVGEPNTGKSKWCRTIDFVFGDEKKVEDKLGATLATKFISASLTMKIGDEEFTAERRWHEAGGKGKVFVGEKGYLTRDFQQLLLPIW
jgi:DNA repair ATPase RecN